MKPHANCKLGSLHDTVNHGCPNTAPDKWIKSYPFVWMSKQSLNLWLAFLLPTVLASADCLTADCLISDGWGIAVFY